MLKLTSYPPAPCAAPSLSPGAGHRLAHSGQDRGKDESQTNGLGTLRGQGGMVWVEDERGWVAEPAEVLNALSNDGFKECKREMTTSRRDCRPAGGVWQGINPRTSSVASVIWWRGQPREPRWCSSRLTGSRSPEQGGTRARRRAGRAEGGVSKTVSPECPPRVGWVTVSSTDTPRSSTVSPNMGDKRREGKVFGLVGSLPNIRVGATRCVWLRRAPGPSVLDAEGGERLGIHPACDSKPLLSLKGA